jgi:capsular polysaccharide biosynthesis protein
VSLIVATELIPPIEVDPNLVTPGVVGFIATFVVAIGVILLLLDMNRRMRRNRYRAEITERLDRETNPEGSEQ